MKIERFEDIQAWKKARQSVSIMSNIAEGFSRQSNPEFLRFLSYATASSAEVQSHLYVALDQGYIDEKAFDRLYSQAVETAKLINAFMTYLRSHRRKGGGGN